MEAARRTGHGEGRGRGGQGEGQWGREFAKGPHTHSPRSGEDATFGWSDGIWFLFIDYCGDSCCHRRKNMPPVVNCSKKE